MKRLIHIIALLTLIGRVSGQSFPASKTQLELSCFSGEVYAKDCGNCGSSNNDQRFYAKGLKIRNKAQKKDYYVLDPVVGYARGNYIQLVGGPDQDGNPTGFSFNRSQVGITFDSLNTLLQECQCCSLIGGGGSGSAGDIVTGVSIVGDQLRVITDLGTVTTTIDAGRILTVGDLTIGSTNYPSGTDIETILQAIENAIIQIDWYVSNDTAYFVDSDGNTYSYYLGSGSSGVTDVTKIDVPGDCDTLVIAKPAGDTKIAIDCPGIGDIRVDSVYRKDNSGITPDSLIVRLTDGSTYGVLLDTIRDMIVSVEIFPDGQPYGCDTLRFFTAFGKVEDKVLCDQAPPKSHCLDTVDLTVPVGIGEGIMYVDASSVRPAQAHEMPQGFVLEELDKGSTTLQRVIMLCGQIEIKDLNVLDQDFWDVVSADADTTYYHTPAGRVAYQGTLDHSRPLHTIRGENANIGIIVSHIGEGYAPETQPQCQTLAFLSASSPPSTGDGIIFIDRDSVRAAGALETPEGVMLGPVGTTHGLIMLCGKYEIYDFAPNENEWPVDGMYYHSDTGTTSVPDYNPRPIFVKRNRLVLSPEYFGFDNTGGENSDPFIFDSQGGTTDANGYLSISHSLGVVPSSAVASVFNSNANTMYSVMVTGMSGTSLNLRVWDDVADTAVASSFIVVNYFIK